MSISWKIFCSNVSKHIMFIIIKLIINFLTKNHINWENYDTLRWCWPFIIIRLTELTILVSGTNPFHKIPFEISASPFQNSIINFPVSCSNKTPQAQTKHEIVQSIKSIVGHTMSDTPNMQSNNRTRSSGSPIYPSLMTPISLLVILLNPRTSPSRSAMRSPLISARDPGSAPAAPHTTRVKQPPNSFGNFMSHLFRYLFICRSISMQTRAASQRTQ